MSKILIVALLVGVLLFFVIRRFMNMSFMAGKRLDRPGFIQMDTDANMVTKTIRTTLTSVAIGFLLFVVVLVLGMKIKILFIMLPISLYLMGQLFLLANHVNHTKRQKIWFNPHTNDLLIEDKKRGNIIINLYRDITDVLEVRSIQKNRNVLFGYFKLTTANNSIHISFLYRANPNNRFFFDALEHDFKIRSSAVFFPMT